jgi:hypothetical protein
MLYLNLYARNEKLTGSLDIGDLYYYFSFVFIITRIIFRFFWKEIKDQKQQRIKSNLALS